MHPSDERAVSLYKRYRRERGGKLLWLAQASPGENEMETVIKRAIDDGAVGVFLVGNLGDRWTFDKQVHLIDLLGGENVKAVGMIDRRGQAALAEEPRPGVGGVQCVPQDLERDAAARLQVLRLKHRAHAALPQQARNLVAPDLVAGLGKPARPGRRGGQRGRLAGRRERLRPHRRLEQAFGAQLRRHAAGKPHAAPGASGPGRGTLFKIDPGPAQSD